MSYGEGTRTVSDDRTLIRYLMRHRHTTPLEMVETEIPCPRADGLLAAMDPPSHGLGQRDEHALLGGHRRRPADAAGRLAEAGPDEPPGQRGPDRAPLGEELTAEEAALQQQARAVYLKRLDRGVAREQARKDLPLSTYTEAYWKIDLHNLFHFLALRMDAHAQLEIRRYAETMGREIVAPLLPLSWEAFVDYRVQGHVAHAAGAGGRCAAGALPARSRPAIRRSWPPAIQAWADLARCRERDECREKLVRLGIVKQGAGSSRSREANRDTPFFVSSRSLLRAPYPKEPTMSDTTTDELLALNRRLLECIAAGDWATYEELCDPSSHLLRAGSPRAMGRGHGVPPFLFQAWRRRRGPVNITVSTPHVRRDGRCGGDQLHSSRAEARRRGNPVTARSEETRVWQRQNGRWRHVHFHRAVVRRFHSVVALAISIAADWLTPVATSRTTSVHLPAIFNAKLSRAVGVVFVFFGNPAMLRQFAAVGAAKLKDNDVADKCWVRGQCRQPQRRLHVNRLAWRRAAAARY